MKTRGLYKILKIYYEDPLIEQMQTYYKGDYELEEK